jgi:hypothetical protein
MLSSWLGFNIGKFSVKTLFGVSIRFRVELGSKYVGRGIKIEVEKESVNPSAFASINSADAACPIQKPDRGLVDPWFNLGGENCNLASKP